MDENESPPAPVLDKYDTDAVLGMFIRVVRIDTANARDRASVAEMTKAIAARTDERKKYIAGISAFGFEMNKPDVWTRVKEALGQPIYNQAFEIALTDETDDRDRPLNDHSAKSHATNADDESKVTADTDDSALNVRDAILRYLRSLPENKGANVAEIKNYLSQYLKTEVHEKTPGMTLYRLSKQELVRREGRTWFAINAEKPSVDHTKLGADQ